MVMSCCLLQAVADTRLADVEEVFASARLVIVHTIFCCTADCAASCRAVISIAFAVWIVLGTLRLTSTHINFHHIVWSICALKGLQTAPGAWHGNLERTCGHVIPSQVSISVAAHARCVAIVPPPGRSWSTQAPVLC